MGFIYAAVQRGWEMDWLGGGGWKLKIKFDLYESRPSTPVRGRCPAQSPRDQENFYTSR